jgi:lysine-N-methylase|tara:strand:+ start:4640 stop:5977 length:1338 start_codon:yes stop_codon:yes gene_type:complete
VNKKTINITVTALKYMNEFSCIGSDCELTCCAGWNIHIDKPSYRRIKSHLMRTPGGKSQLKQNIKRYKKGEHEGFNRFGHIKLKEDQSCSFLAKDGFCNLQRDFGEKTLPGTCSTFPRRITLHETNFELSGDFGCPEIVRKSLLTDHSMNRVEYKDNIKKTLLHVPIENGNSLYLQYYKQFREIMIDTLESKFQPTFRQKMFALIFIAKKIYPHFNKQNQNTNLEPIEEGLSLIKNNEFLNLMTETYEKIPMENNAALILINEIILSKALGGKNRLQYNSLVESSIKSYLNDIKDYSVSKSETHNIFQIPVRFSEPFFDAYKSRKSEFEKLFSNRMDVYMERYLVNLLFQDPYIHFDDLMLYFRHILLKAAIIRFLIIGHPSIIHLITQTKQEEKSMQELDAIAVEIFSVCERIYRNTPMISKVSQALGLHDFDSLAHLTMLIHL